MDSKFLDYYNRELAYLREMGAEFAEHYPKVAGRLGMHGIDVADPYVERLMEGFAFLTARIQLKMDAAFPHFSQSLLEIIYPNYLSPTPSMAIAELHLDSGKGDISNGFLVPRGTKMDSQTLKKEGIACSYTTAHDVLLQPVRITSVKFGGVCADIPLADLGLQHSGCSSALRIQLECLESVTVNDLQLDQLMFYLAGPDMQAQRLLELLMQHSVGMVGQTVDAQPLRKVLDLVGLRHEGLAADQALLPNDLRNFEGYRLLQEYFALPARFQFFSIGGLRALLQEVRKENKAPRSFEIVVFLNRQDAALERAVDVTHLALHCTPVINLFPKTAERITVDEKNHEYHLVLDKVRPLDYEVFSVRKLIGNASEKRGEQEFRPFYSTSSNDGCNHGAYFSVRREARLLSDHARQYGRRTGYAGSEVFISLVDERHSPWPNDLKYLTADVLCTSRDLPLMLQRREQGSFMISDSIPVKGISLRKGPTPPRPALAQDLATWQLISQLQLNYLSIMDVDPEQGATSLRQLLGLYCNLSEPVIAKQIHGVRHCNLRSIYRRAPEPGPVMFARGVAIDLMVDEQAFSGGSPYLLGSVLERMFSRLVAMNSFTETTLSSQQRGKIADWPARIGTRTLV